MAYVTPDFKVVPSWRFTLDDAEKITRECAANDGLYTHCTACDPCSPEMDEDGKPYTCYCCGDTGWLRCYA